MGEKEARQQRGKQLLKKTGFWLLIGFLYFLFVSATHLYLPCPIRLVTGWKCPGCGISHYFVHLLHGEMREAFAANAFVFCLAPFALVYAGYRAYRYVQDGFTRTRPIETAALVLVCVAAVAFGILRNLVPAG